MTARRLTAAAALLLAAASFVLAIITAVRQFPRGLIVLVLVVAALAVGWHAVLRRGTTRVVGLALAAAALVVAIVLLVARDPLATLTIVVAAGAALTAARGAFALPVRLPTVPPPKRAVLIFNPHSGGGKAERFRLADEARRRGIEPIELGKGDDLNELVDDALARGADALAAAGGDGTQAIIAAAAARAGVPFACIPAGTRNHFALDLGVDRDDVVGALDAFVRGSERAVDLAEVNGRVFVNNVSLGLYADAVQRAGYREAKMRTLIDTVPEVAGPQAATPPMRWRDPDGISHEGGVALLVSNNRYRLGRAIGSGTRPRLDAGQLGVTVIEPSGGIRHGLLRSWSLAAMEVEGAGEMPAGIDGEAALLKLPLRFVMHPAALRVRVSGRHPGQSPSATLPENAWDGMLALGRIALHGSQG